MCKFVKCNELQLGRPLPQQRLENSPHSQRPEAGNCEAIFKTILGKHIQYLGMVIIGFCVICAIINALSAFCSEQIITYKLEYLFTISYSTYDMLLCTNRD